MRSVIPQDVVVGLVKSEESAVSIVVCYIGREVVVLGHIVQKESMLGIAVYGIILSIIVRTVDKTNSMSVVIRRIVVNLVIC